MSIALIYQYQINIFTKDSLEILNIYVALTHL